MREKKKRIETKERMNERALFSHFALLCHSVRSFVRIFYHHRSWILFECLSALFTELYQTQSQSGTQYAQMRQSEPLKHLINICIVSIWIVVVVVYADGGCHLSLINAIGILSFLVLFVFVFGHLFSAIPMQQIVVGVTQIFPEGNPHV